MLAELHRSFTSLSQEDQKFAEIFLHDIQRGDVKIDSDRTFRDYLVDYTARAKNKDFAAIVTTLGVDAVKLAALLDAHVTEASPPVATAPSRPRVSVQRWQRP